MLGIVSGILLVTGFFFLMVGTLGLLRLPDTYTRLHATGKCDTLGALLVTVGCALMAGGLAPAAKLMAVAVFIWIVNPATTHMIARVARATGVPMVSQTRHVTRGEVRERGRKRAR